MKAVFNEWRRWESLLQPTNVGNLDFFSVLSSDDTKYACSSCTKISRGGNTPCVFNMLNLVNHLKSRHFKDIKKYEADRDCQAHSGIQSSSSSTHKKDNCKRADHPGQSRTNHALEYLQPVGSSCQLLNRRNDCVRFTVFLNYGRARVPTPLLGKSSRASGDPLHVFAGPLTSLHVQGLPNVYTAMSV